MEVDHAFLKKREIAFAGPNELKVFSWYSIFTAQIGSINEYKGSHKHDYVQEWNDKHSISMTLPHQS